MYPLTWWFFSHYFTKFFRIVSFLKHLLSFSQVNSNDLMKKKVVSKVNTGNTKNITASTNKNNLLWFIDHFADDAISKTPLGSMNSVSLKSFRDCSTFCIQPSIWRFKQNENVLRNWISSSANLEKHNLLNYVSPRCFSPLLFNKWSILI